MVIISLALLSDIGNINSSSSFCYEDKESPDSVQSAMFLQIGIDALPTVASQNTCILAPDNTLKHTTLLLELAMLVGHTFESMKVSTQPIHHNIFYWGYSNQRHNFNMMKLHGRSPYRVKFPPPPPTPSSTTGFCVSEHNNYAWEIIYGNDLYIAIIGWLDPVRKETVNPHRKMG